MLPSLNISTRSNWEFSINFVMLTSIDLFNLFVPCYQQSLDRETEPI